MSDPDHTTQTSYDEIATEFLAKTRDPTRGRKWLDRFAVRLEAGALVADVGSGPGRDCAQLRGRGFEAFCLDRSLGMLRAGIDSFPAERMQGDLRSLPLRARCLAGAWANASLLHLSPDGLAAALAELARVLRPAGQLHLTLKQGVGSGFETAKYGRPRWFQYWSSAGIDAALESAGFRIVEAETDAGRSEVWLVRLCQLEVAPHG